VLMRLSFLSPDILAPFLRPRDGIRIVLHDPFTAQAALFQHALSV
jgi:hypothetical protein